MIYWAMSAPRLIGGAGLNVTRTVPAPAVPPPHHEAGTGELSERVSGLTPQVLAQSKAYLGIKHVSRQ